MKSINILFYSDSVIFNHRPYANKIEALIKNITTTIGESESKLIFDIRFIDRGILDCIESIVSGLIEPKNIIAIDFNVTYNEVKKIDTEYCNTIIKVLKQLTCLREIGIQTVDRLLDVYNYVILESKITKMELRQWSYSYHTDHIKCISDVLKLAGNKSSIKTLEIDYEEWYEVKMILDSYPALEEYEIGIKNSRHLKSLCDDKEVCPNLRKIRKGWGTCTLDVMESIVKWSRLSDQMKTISFNNATFNTDALRYLLADIESSVDRTHIECFVTENCRQNVNAVNYIQNIQGILEKRRKAIKLIILLKDKNLSPYVINSVIVRLLCL